MYLELFKYRSSQIIYCSNRCLTIIAIICFLSSYSSAQIQVETSNNQDLSIDYLINSVFLGNGVKVNSVRKIGSNQSIGLFTNGQNDINLGKGLVLSTGSVRNIDKPNTSTSTGDTAEEDFVVSDPDLQALTTNDIKEVTGIEIEFVAQSDDLEFRYVFASEEYPEFTCSKFNDIFAFFIDGPNPMGGQYVKKNIALVPDPSDPSGNTFTDFPVWTNSVNSGAIGDGTNGDFCNKEDESLMFSDYYNDNSESLTFTFDGFLDVFKAKANLIPCETYTIKIIIGDNNDFDFDSAVFLEANSLSTRKYSYYLKAGIGNILYESCEMGSIGIRFDEPVDVRTEIPVNVLSGNSREATQGVDYTLSSNTFILNPGEQSAEIRINAVEDNIVEGTEFISFGENINGCVVDTFIINLNDNPIQEAFSSFKDAAICRNELLSDINLPEPRNRELDFNSEFVIQEIGSTNSETVSFPIDIDFVSQASMGEVFSELCLDGFTHEDLSEIEILLQSPDGIVTKLVDQGSMSGSAFGETICYTNDADLVTKLSRFANSSIRGEWNLIITDKVINSSRGSIDRWTLQLINPDYFQYSLTTRNGDSFDPRTPIISDMEITVAAEDIFGCTYSDIVEITVIDDILAPTDLTCTELDRDILQFSWMHQEPNIQFEINAGNGWENIGNTFLFVVDNLEPNQTVPFAVRAIAGSCSSAEADLVCGTPQCVEPEIIVSRKANNTSACDPNGLIEIRSSNTKGPYFYSIDGNDAPSSLFEGLNEGSYTVNIVDGYGCTNQLEVTIEGIPQVEIEIEVFDAFCGQQGFIDLFVTGGTPPYQYLWSTNSTDQNINGLDAGDYSVTVKDRSGCEFFETVTIRQSSELEINNIVTNDPSCYGGNDGSVFFNISGGSFDYQTKVVDESGGVVASNTELGAGNYRIEVLDTHECISIDSFVITDRDSIQIDFSIVQPPCVFVDEGSIDLNISGGKGPYEIVWSNGIINTTSLDQLSAGSYSVEVVDNSGCRTSQNILLEAIGSPTINYQVRNISCFGNADGMIDINSPDTELSVIWDDNSNLLNRRDLRSGTYCGRILTDSGCYLDTCFVLVEPEIMSSSATITDNICFEQNDGTIDINIEKGVPPYRLIYNSLDTIIESSFFIDGLASGSHSFTITDNSGCWILREYRVEPAPEVIITAEIVNNSCKGDQLGRISPLVEGLDGPLVPFWVGPDSTAYNTLGLSNLASGVYVLSVSNASGCSFSESFVVAEPEDALSADYLSNDLSCFNSNDGEINVLVTGGVGGINYTIDNNNIDVNGTAEITDNSGVFNGLSRGVYSIEVSDQSGCTFLIEDVEINEPERFVIDLSVDTVAYEYQDLDINVDISGAQGEVDLFWDSDPIDQLPCSNCDSVTITALENTLVVAVEAFDDEGCVAYDEKKIFIQRANHVSVPTGFTPNGDNVNDRLFIYGTPGAVIRVFSVYDRTGVRLYFDQNIEVNKESKGWDGYFKGDQLIPGSYMWTAIADFEDGRSESFSGTVQLIR